MVWETKVPSEVQGQIPGRQSPEADHILGLKVYF